MCVSSTPLSEGTFHSVVKEIRQSVRLQHTPCCLELWEASCKHGHAGEALAA